MRLPTMNEKTFFLLGFFLLHAFVSESAIIPRDRLLKEGSFGNEEIPLSLDPLDNGKKLGFEPGIGDQPKGDGEFGLYEYDTGVNGETPSVIEEIIPSPGKNDRQDPNDKDAGKSGGEPFDEEDSDKSIGRDRDEGPTVDEDELIHKDVDESLDVDGSDKKDSGEDDADKNEHVPVDEDDTDKEGEEEGDDVEDETDKEPNDDEEEADKADKDDGDVDDEDDGDVDDKDDGDVGDKDDGDVDDKDDGDLGDKEDDNNDDKDDDVGIHGGEEAGFFSGGSIFDTPFFNLEKVKKYFSQLDRALGQVYRQTIDEALLLNGTYANTTEEEIDIDGKKYIVQKSVIQGADNHSSIYVEALSSKPKMSDSEVIKDIEAKNVTDV